VHGLHVGSGAWSFMAHGVLNGVYTKESGPRGDSGRFGTGMMMLAARRGLSRGAIGFRAMVTAEPAMGASGYPLVLQTGETADGVTPLVDRQHPHDALMELAAMWSRQLEDDRSVFVYLAPVGEPPIGPSAFMHRPSALGSPFPPISHHFLDSTHVTHGVATVGFVANESFKMEVGAFNGHEPDEKRWGLQAPRLNSLAGRLTVNPGADWSIQWSVAHLDEPERLHPGLDMLRMTASVTHNRPLAGGNWQTTLAWGRNKREIPPRPSPGLVVDPSVPGHVHYISASGEAAPEPRTIQNALLVESTATLARWHTLHARVERAQKDELFPPSDARHATLFTVSRLTFGYVVDVPVESMVRMGVGVSASVAAVPAALEQAYGSSPWGAALFFRARLGR
jgi:hypothetical protein